MAIGLRYVPVLLYVLGLVFKPISIWLCYLVSQVGYTSAPGQGGILAQREFDRRFSPHYVSFLDALLSMLLLQGHKHWAPMSSGVCTFFSWTGLHLAWWPFPQLASPFSSGTPASGSMTHQSPRKTEDALLGLGNEGIGIGGTDLGA